MVREEYTQLYFCQDTNLRVMQEEQPSREQLLLEIEKLHQELEKLKRDKADLEILLETTTAHADILEAQFHESNKQLQAEIVERQRTEALLQASEAELQSLLERVTQDKVDLEILLETTTEHADTVEAELQHKAEEAVRESERRLAQFLEAVPVGVAVLDANGKIYYTNRTAQQLLGKGVVPEVTRERIAEVYKIYVAGTQQEYPSAQLPIVRALSGESSTADDMEIHQAEKIIPIEAWGTPIFDEQGKIGYAIVAFQDITERKRAEEALRLAEAKYRNIFENALEGIFQTTPDGHYISVNPSMARLYGYQSPAEMIASVTEIGHQIYVDPTCRDEFRHLIEEQGEVKGFEYQVYRRDGRIIWVSESTRAVHDASGRLLYYEGIAEDITKRKQQEEALKRQVQELRIEIDKTKQAQKVAEIVESDSFQSLKQKLQRMKKSREEKEQKS